MTVRSHTDEATVNRMAVKSPTESRLDIRLSDRFEPLPGPHNLLLGFHFGSKPTSDDHPAIISLKLQPLTSDQLFEGWWYQGDVTYTNSGPVRIAECLDYTVASIQLESVGTGGIRVQTYHAYLELLHAVRSTNHAKLVKVWNYFGDITSGDDDLEKYRQFSIGRAGAFQELGITDEVAPTATAIGTQPGSGLTLIALASNRDFCPVENPRQVSAFNYPREYGPSSPNFSRGGFVSSDNHQLFLISGTAAVVGHESNSPFNTGLQTREMIRNLEHLCQAISDLNTGGPQLVLDGNSVLRVYLKNVDDYDLVAKRIEKEMRACKHNMTFLQGTICREELMVEIDGVKVS